MNTFKVYEWGTVGKGQIEYDGFEEVKQALSPYVQVNQKNLKPVALTGWLIEGTAFFVAVERQPDELQMKLDQAQGFIDEMCAENNSQGEG